MLPHDLQYYLDCSVEIGNLTQDIYWWLRLVDKDAAKRMDSLDQRVLYTDNANHSLHLFEQCRALEHDYVASGIHEHSHILKSCGALGLSFIVRDCVKYAYDTQLEETNKLDIATFMAQYHIDKKLESFYRTARRADSVEFGKIPEYAEQVYRLAEKEREEVQELIRNAVDRVEVAYEDMVVNPYNKKKVRRLREKSSKKALIKSVNLANSVMPKQDVKMFLSGNEILIEGREYKFGLVKTGSLNSSHGGVGCKLYDKEGKYLNHICIYSDDVPVMDHVVNMYLTISAGQEEEIINTGNFYKLNDSGGRISVGKDGTEYPVDAGTTLDRLRDIFPKRKTLSNHDKKVLGKKIYTEFNNVVDMNAILKYSVLGLKQYEHYYRIG